MVCERLCFVQRRSLISPRYVYALHRGSAQPCRALMHIWYVGLLQAQQTNIPYTWYASVSAQSKDARLSYCNVSHRGLARPCRASMHIKYAGVFAQSKDARIPCIRYVGLLQAQQTNIPYTWYASVSARSKDARLSHCNVLHRGSARP